MNLLGHILGWFLPSLVQASHPAVVVPACTSGLSVTIALTAPPTCAVPRPLPPGPPGSAPRIRAAIPDGCAGATARVLVVNCTADPVTVTRIRTAASAWEFDVLRSTVDPGEVWHHDLRVGALSGGSTEQVDVYFASAATPATRSVAVPPVTYVPF